MNEKDLLLSDEAIDLSPRLAFTSYCKEHDVKAGGSFGEYTEVNQFCDRAIAQAQLDKILKPKWINKPDSKGWWWFEIEGICLKAKYPCYFHSDRNQIQEWGHDGLKDLSSMPEAGKWTKVIVPGTYREQQPELSSPKDKRIIDMREEEKEIPTNIIKNRPFTLRL